MQLKFSTFLAAFLMALMLSSCGSNTKMQNEGLVFKAKQFYSNNELREIANTHVDLYKGETAINKLPEIAQLPSKGYRKQNFKQGSKRDNELKSNKISIENKLAPLKKLTPPYTEPKEDMANIFGLISLISGILTIISLVTGVGNILFGIAAIVFSILAKSAMKKKGVVDDKTKKMATWGMILGIAGIVIGIIVTLVLFAVGLGWGLLSILFSGSLVALPFLVDYY